MWRLLILIGLALGLMIGLVSKAKAGRMIMSMIFFPIIMLIAWSVVTEIWQNLNLLEKIVGVVVGGFLLLALVFTRTSFGREVFGSFLGDVVHDIFLGSIKLVKNFLRLIFMRRRS